MEEGETIVAKVHRHWLFIFLRIAVLALVFIAPSVIVALLEGVGLVNLDSVSGAAQLALWSLWGLVLWALFWQFWTTYYMDIWVVTNKRIIDINYERLFDRNIAMVRLDRVQDIATRVQGVVGTLLKFGSVVVQSAGSDKEFVIDQIANPEALRDVINTLAGEAGTLRVVKTD